MEESAPPIISLPSVAVIFSLPFVSPTTPTPSAVATKTAVGQSAPPIIPRPEFSLAHEQANKAITETSATVIILISVFFICANPFK